MPPRRKPTRIITPYEKWKRTHPGEDFTRAVWLKLQVDAAEALALRLQKELDEEIAKGAGAKA